jgi:3-oxoacyl-[acyl-carrier-protein] synthase II
MSQPDKVSRTVFLGGFNEGVRTCVASGWTRSWLALLSGKHSFASFRNQLPSWPDEMPVGHLPDFGPELRGRATALSVELANDLRNIVKEVVDSNPGVRFGIILATSHGEPSAVSCFAEKFSRDDSVVSVESAKSILGDVLLPSFLNSIGRKHSGSTISAACASACVATGVAYSKIESGLLDAILVVSLDVLSRVAHTGFRQIGAMSPERCRPFDQNRNGTTISEAGASYLLFNATTRPPTSIRNTVMIRGFGQFCDARHSVEPSADGIASALRNAISQAEIAAKDIGAVYWHGTGTIQNDRAEAKVAHEVFGDNVPPGTSTKGVFGHAMGASCALSILAACETVNSGIIPHVAGLENVAFDNLNLICGEPSVVTRRTVAVVALGFGGINASVILDLPEGLNVKHYA